MNTKSINTHPSYQTKHYLTGATPCGVPASHLTETGNELGSGKDMGGIQEQQAESTFHGFPLNPIANVEPQPPPATHDS
ncbi:hypothetical protein BDW02DRAFT_569601 [Decorospora gaudefroyi]|uniref:Uncharacterized protein n=1 Tax=Decorospora gaudefroyi TaxID=184978 RepID=A0A6A5KEI0_9PLEO|nr:hypothetical protein BDW02DRAFT_569601 [Decorospora gaudefroyi]